MRHSHRWSPLIETDKLRKFEKNPVLIVWFRFLLADSILMAGLDKHRITITCECGTVMTFDRCHLASPPIQLVKYPEFILCEDRIKTFKNWPKYLGATAQDLAEAGFVYSGCGDECFCYHCGVRAKNWRPWDNAKKEHLEHSPQCRFIRTVYSTPAQDSVKGYDEVDG